MMNVGLIFGGNSYEHNVSIVSAKIISKIIRKNHNLALLFFDYDNNLYLIKNIEQDDIKKKAIKINLVKGGFKTKFRRYKLDVLFSVMHGANGEDGLAYSVANYYDIPYVGPNHIASGILMDKYYSYLILKAHNYPVIKSDLIEKNALPKDFSYPVILKPSTLGSSIGIKVIENDDDLKKFDLFEFDDKIIVQKYLHEFREFNQAAYLKNDEIILSKVEEVFKHDSILSFTDKYLGAKGVEKHHYVNDDVLIKKISVLTESLYRFFKLSGPVRFDYMLCDKKLYINEVNTTPGSLAYYLFDIKKELFIDDLIYEALIEKQNKKHLHFESEILEHYNGLKKG